MRRKLAFKVVATSYPGHMKEQDMQQLLKFAAELARDGKANKALLLKAAFDDLRGTPLPPKGMHTN